MVPAELRARHGWTQGTPMLFIETDQGVLVTTRERALARVREQLRDADLVAELVSERREAAAREDDA